MLYYIFEVVYCLKRVLSFVLSFVVGIICFSLTACEQKREKFTDYSFDYFDTVTTIIGFEKSNEVFKENCNKIKEQLESYHKLYTIYTRYDGLNNLCMINSVKNGGHSEYKVDKKIIDMLEFSKEMYTLTNGRVNVAMGSVLSIWHNYRQRGLNNPADASLPDINELKTAAEHIDINNLIIDKEKGTVYISDNEMSLDVGAIAKGYAVEEVALWMEKQGIDGYILNVGGNVRVVGARPDGENWKIGIENPQTESKDEYIEYLSFNDMSLVTSGSYQRFYVVNGKSYNHIIDPDTLFPSEKYLSVSVLCKSSAMADSLSTALFTMDYDDGKRLIDSLDKTEALWVFPNGTKKYSDGFKLYTVD